MRIRIVLLYFPKVKGDFFLKKKKKKEKKQYEIVY